MSLLLIQDDKSKKVFKGQILEESTCMRYPEYLVFLEAKSTMVDARSREEEKMRSYCLTGTEIQFCKIGVLWMDVVW